MTEERPRINWMDGLWLVFLAGLALLPPVLEIHKQLILLAFGAIQLSEGWVLSKLPGRGAIYIVLLKIAFAMLLIDHTGEISINSSYWPIYFLPIMTAAEYFGPWTTLAWTALAAASYCSYLVLALQEYDVTSESYEVLAIRVLFFFLAGTVVNRFVVENRRQTARYQQLAETLAETNFKLEQAQAEARRSERLAALGQLSAGLAHEIRNPLGVIRGSAEMLNQKLDKSNPLAAELAGYISSETNRLSDLVTRFLDFARPLHTDLVRQELAPVLDRALHNVATVRKQDTVRIEKEYENDLPPVPLDESLAEQAFVNIVQNAYDALGEGGGTLRVKVARSSPAGRDGVEVRIMDTGPGIAPELREQIFNPFVTTKKTGVGLGLSIVSKIMDGHEGFVRIEPQVTGSGACFVMFFPTVVAADSTASAPSVVVGSETIQ
jgi:two-component system, NtrC family, sensor histidine kinase HydH